MRGTLLCALGIVSACDRGGPTQSPDPTTTGDQAATGESEEPAEDQALAEAQAMAKRVVILDGHIDVPMRVAGAEREGLPIPAIHDHTEGGNFDYERAVAGGLDAPFMSIYTPADFEAEPGKSFAFANERIDYVVELVNEHPDRFAFANTPAEVMANFDKGLISLPMGMENGSPIEGDLAKLRHFYDRGIRYITLTHSKDNHICDSSYDQHHTHHGLTEFGREVVAEMNKLGIMIDVSHLSDETFWQIMDLSAVPVIASHSSCRHFTPGFERNMSDEMIKELADNEGVIQINFGSGFLDASYREAEEKARPEIRARLEEAGVEWWSTEGKEIIAAYRAEHPLPEVGVDAVVDHIMHVVDLVGVNHVGLGSDFDGVGDSLPKGLDDVSMYPNLIAALLERGLHEEDIQKICSANVLRVWQAVEDHAATHR